MIYKKIIKPILWLLDAETAHDFVLWNMSWVSKSKVLNKILFKFCDFTSPRIRQNIWGLDFRTPIGLSAGMDKNASAPKAWGALDFGWVEIGSVTAVSQPGNPKPRLWRIPEDKGIIVHYGLYSLGAQKIAERLKKAEHGFIAKNFWSISLAKTTHTPMEQAYTDYARAFEILEPYGKMFTINLSCPNVKGFTGLQDKRLLEPILSKITQLNKNKKPIWLKIGPDMSNQELDDVIELVKKYKIQAIVACNLYKNRDKLNLKSKYLDKPGGISGRSIAARVNEVIAYLYRHSQGQYKIIGVGGIFDGRDAYAKVKAGADLLQIATGFVYGGPLTIKKINKQLDELLRRDGYNHISEAVGQDAEQYIL